MILLKRITLTNFLSHENTTIDFSENEKALIDGASGAGKSSIFDAIIWSLYGVSRADNRSLVRKGAKMGSVTLTLDNNGEIIIITRRTTSSGKHVLELLTEQPDGKRIAYPLSGVRELQNHIEKNIIGASYLLFINSVAYVQGNTESFVAQTAPKRKELLLEIVKAEDYTKYYENARQTLSALENDHTKGLADVGHLEGRIESLKTNIELRTTRELTISSNTELLKEIEPKIAELEDKKAKFMAASQNVKNLETILLDSIKDVDSALLSFAKQSSKLLGKKALLDVLSTAPELHKALDSHNKKTEVLRKEMTDASEKETVRNELLRKKPIVYDDNFQTIDRKNLQIEEIKKNPKCPSGLDCPYSGNHLKEIEKLRNDIKILKEISEKEAVALANWSIEFGKLPLQVNLGNIVKLLKEHELDSKSLEKQISDLDLVKKEIGHIEEIETAMPDLEKEIEEKKLRVIKAKIDKKNAEESINSGEGAKIIIDLNEKKKEQDSFKESITRAEAALESIAYDELELSSTETRLVDIRDFILSVEEKRRKVELVKQAFGSKGIETLVIDYLLPKLEDKVNEVLAKLSDFRVRIDTQKKKADGDGVTEGLFITILNEVNEEMPFESYSGGEKLKISVAISEALATLQKVGFRLFDETFLSLDENSTESFSRVLQDLQKNFSQVLCISHLLQIKELFDKKLNIIKNKNISYVK